MWPKVPQEFMRSQGKSIGETISMFYTVLLLFPFLFPFLFLFPFSFSFSNPFSSLLIRINIYNPNWLGSSNPTSLDNSFPLLHVQYLFLLSFFDWGFHLDMMLLLKMENLFLLKMCWCVRKAIAQNSWIYPHQVCFFLKRNCCVSFKQKKRKRERERGRVYSL